MNAKRILLFAALASFSFGIPAIANQGLDPEYAPAQASAYPPLQNWAVDSGSFLSQLRSQRSGIAKAATDATSVYRPLPPCRIFDTRGLPAAIVVPGPFAPNSTTNINSAGTCGIPDNGLVVALSVAIFIENLTPNNGGYIATQQQGEPVTAINTVLNLGAVWTGATANITIPNGSGDFSVYLANSQAHVIIDVNGYYQNLDSLDTGLQELDIVGNTAGDTLGVLNSGTGTAIYASATNGTAIEIGAGRLRVVGAGVNTNTLAFIHQVDATAAFGSGGTICGGFPQYTVINHPHLNGDPNAIVMITARDAAGTPGPSAGPWSAFYFTGGCTPTVTGYWGINDLGGAAQVTGAQYNVMVIKP